jgi:hypothetical protein
MDWRRLAEHAKDVRAIRIGKEPAPERGALAVDVGQVLRYRMRATHLDRRLPAGSHGEAAYGGLQDSSPRDAVLALHARLDEVASDGWEHPSLAQIWFRWSDYVVPRDALAAFTLGVLPRDPARRQALHDLADRALDVLAGEPMSSRRLAESIPGLPDPHFLRMLSATGKIHIRWDASRIDVLQVTPPDADDEDARVELARRFLHWLGPASAAHLARWAGVTRPDAEATWLELTRRHELVPIDLDGRTRWLLAEDEAALRQDEPLATVRLLPPGDPVLYLDKHLVVPDPPDHIAQRQPSADVPQRLLNSLYGRVLLDGRIVASWGRAGGKVTLVPWHDHDLATDDRDRIAGEVHSLAVPLPRPVTLRWLPD